MNGSSNDVTVTRLVERSWFKSHASSASCACVEVRFDADAVLIRDSKYRRRPEADLANEPTIRVLIDAWLALLDELVGVRLAGTGGALAIATTEHSTTIRSVTTGTELVYTAAEWDAFLVGVKAGEFTPELVLA